MCINAEHLKQQHMGISHETTDVWHSLTWNGQKEKNTQGNIRDRWARAHQKINDIYMEREWVRNWEREIRRCWSGGLLRWSETQKVKIERERYLTFRKKKKISRDKVWGKKWGKKLGDKRWTELASGPAEHENASTSHIVLIKNIFDNVINSFHI